MPDAEAACDLVVVGGGPVGLAAALHAARAGLDVELYEPRRGPVDKACGEGLMPRAVAALAELDIDPAGHPITGIRYLDGDTEVEARFRHGPGRGVRRTVLHEQMRAAAHDAGVRIVAHPVERIDQDDDGVLVDGRRARHVIAADGLHSRVRRLVGVERPSTRRRRFGLRAHAPIAPWTSLVEVHWAGHSEAYVTPVADDLVGLAVLTDRPRSFPELVAQHPALAERFAGVDWQPVRGAGPLRQRTSQRVVGRVLLVGDAAGYVDAITGEGLALGLTQAQAAVEAVAADRPDDYEDAYLRLTRRHDRLTLALLRSSRLPGVRRRLVPLAHRLPRVFDALVDQLARPA